MELLGWVWFTSRSTVGIVLCKNEVEEKAYIMGVPGHDEQSDLKQIMDWGAKFPVDVAKTLISRFGTLKNQEPAEDPIEKLNELFDSPQFFDEFVDYLARKKEIEESHENRLLRIFNSIEDSKLHDFILKILSWESKFEEMKYTKHQVQTESNVFSSLTRLLMKMGTPLEISDENDEDFLASGFVWEDFVFKIYIGQGAIVTVEYKGKKVFQSA